MRRAEQEITDKKEIEDIITKAGTARLGLNREGAPYIVPMNFGYIDDTFYFHCAGEGLKLDLLKADPDVCIEIDESSELQKGGKENPCKWGVDYRSVIATGRAELLADIEEKRAALGIIVEHFTGGEVPPMNDERIRSTTVFKVVAATLTAKQSD